MKRHHLIPVIISIALLGQPSFLFSQAFDHSGRLIIYYGEKKTGFETYSVSASEGKIRLKDHAQFKIMETDFVISMHLVSNTLLFPESLAMGGEVGGERYRVSTKFLEGKAINRTTRDGDTSTAVVSIHKNAVILPYGLFYPYTFLVKRYDFEKGGKQEFFGYIVPQTEVPVSLEYKGREKVDFESGSLELERLLASLRGALGVNLWLDETKELTKLSIPLQGIEVYRQGYKPVPKKAAIDTLPKRYTSEDITFRSGELKLAGTVTIPKNGEKPHRACIIISGSGPQDRNGKVPNLGFSVQYEAIAHELSNSGILVLRYDERGVEESEGDFKTASLSDFVSDIEAGIKYLRSRPDVDTGRICLLGHSEGAIIAPLIAVEDQGIKAIVLMAGTAKPLDQVMTEQQAFLLSKENISDEMKLKAIEQQREFFDWVRGKKEWEDEKMPLQYKELKGKRNWFLQHFNHDPLETITRVKCKVLMLQGKKDKQVFDLHAVMLSNALDRAGHKDHMVTIFPDLDHLFCKTKGEGDYAEYADIERPIDAEFLRFLVDWLDKEL